MGMMQSKIVPSSCMVLWVLNVMERRRLGKLNMNYLRGALGPIVMDWIVG